MRTGRTTGCCPAADRVAGTMSRRREWLRVPSPNANGFSNDRRNYEEMGQRVCHIQRIGFNNARGHSEISASIVQRTNFCQFRAARQRLPMKSRLPISTPLWRRMAYAVVIWKNTLGIAQR